VHGHESFKIGRGVTQECCLLLILFNWYSEYITKEAIEGFGDLGQAIRTVKYAYYLVLCPRNKRYCRVLLKS
jgi:hypothetical protein